jgi:hypothetical protein
MIGMTIVEKILARNSPGAFSEAKIAENSEIAYMDNIKIIPMTELIRFTLFIGGILSFLFIS